MLNRILKKNFTEIKFINIDVGEDPKLLSIESEYARDFLFDVKDVNTNSINNGVFISFLISPDYDIYKDESLFIKSVFACLLINLNGIEGDNKPFVDLLDICLRKILEALLTRSIKFTHAQHMMDIMLSIWLMMYEKTPEPYHIHMPKFLNIKTKEVIKVLSMTIGGNKNNCSSGYLDARYDSLIMRQKKGIKIIEKVIEEWMLYVDHKARLNILVRNNQRKQLAILHNNIEPFIGLKNVEPIRDIITESQKDSEINGKSWLFKDLTGIKIRGILAISDLWNKQSKKLEDKGMEIGYDEFCVPADALFIALNGWAPESNHKNRDINNLAKLMIDIRETSFFIIYDKGKKIRVESAFSSVEFIKNNGKLIFNFYDLSKYIFGSIQQFDLLPISGFHLIGQEKRSLVSETRLVKALLYILCETKSRRNIFRIPINLVFNIGPKSGSLLREWKQEVDLLFRAARSCKIHVTVHFDKNEIYFIIDPEKDNPVCDYKISSSDVHHQELRKIIDKYN